MRPPVVVDNVACVRDAVDPPCRTRAPESIGFVGNPRAVGRPRNVTPTNALAGGRGCRLRLHLHRVVQPGRDGGVWSRRSRRPGVPRGGLTAVICSTDRVALGLDAGAGQVPWCSACRTTWPSSASTTWRAGGPSDPSPGDDPAQDFSAEGVLAAQLILSELQGIEVPRERNVIQGNLHSHVSRAVVGPAARFNPPNQPSAGRRPQTRSLDHLAIDLAAGPRRVKPGGHRHGTDLRGCYPQGGLGHAKSSTQTRRSTVAPFTEGLGAPPRRALPRARRRGRRPPYDLGQLRPAPPGWTSWHSRAAAANLARQDVLALSLDEQFNVGQRTSSAASTKTHAGLAWFSVADARAA